MENESNNSPSKDRENDNLFPIFQSNTLLIFFGIAFLYFFMKKVGILCGDVVVFRISVATFYNQ